MPATVYSITHRATGREYIGVTSRDVETRWREHCHQAKIGRRTRIAYAIRRYGVEAFEFQVRASLPTFEEAKLAERIAVALERPAFNLTAGGDGTVGFTHSADTCRKLAEKARGRKRTPEANAKIRAALTGRKRSPAAIEASRRANLGNTHGVGVKHSAESVERTAAAHRGCKRSAETRAKLSALAKARGVSDEMRAAAIAANRGRPRSAETRARIAAAVKAALARKKAASCR